VALEPGAAPVRNIAALSKNRSATGGFSRDQKAPPQKPAGAEATTGALGVQESKRARAQQDVSRVESNIRTDQVKTVGGKTFYLRDRVWTDSDYKADAKLPETRVKFASSEYFDLLKSHPKLGTFLALGEEVLVVFEGRVYRVESAN